MRDSATPIRAWRGADGPLTLHSEDAAAERPSQVQFQCSRRDLSVSPIPRLPPRADPSFASVFKQKVALVADDRCCWEDPLADREAKFAITSALDEIFELVRSTRALTVPVIDSLLQLAEFPLLRDRSPPNRLSRRCDEMVAVAEPAWPMYHLM
jgi:hypothetical protein